MYSNVKFSSLVDVSWDRLKLGQTMVDIGGAPYYRPDGWHLLGRLIKVILCRSLSDRHTQLVALYSLK
jgi:hypothetical protein